MIYFATILILLGLLFFVIASLAPEEISKLKPNKKKSKQTKAFHKEILKKAPLVNTNLQLQKKTTLNEEQFLRDRRIYNKKPIQTEIKFTMPSLEEIKEEPISLYKESTIIKTEPGLIYLLEFKALVYLDYTNKIADSRNQAFLIENLLNHFKRVGLSKILKTKESFLLENSNSIFEYKLDEIEEILFFEEALSLVPKKNIFPLLYF